MKKLIPLAMFATFLALMILWRWAGPFGKFLGPPATYLGVLPALMGSILSILGLRRLMKAGTTVKAFHQPQRLVTDGIYRYTRNPIYLGLALVLAGACILMGAGCLLVPVAIFVAIADRWIVRAEDRMLSQKFGQEFEAYRGRTRRWI